MRSNERLYFMVGVLCIVVLISISGCKKKTEEAEAVREESGQKPVTEKAKPENSGPKDEKKFVISSSPKDGQFIRGLKRPIIVSFSKDVAEDDYSFSINPDPGGWAESWGRERHVILSHSNPFEPGVTYTLEVEVESEDVKKSVRFTAYGKSSLELINEDVENGILDLDTAWTYRLQRLFEPLKLPGKYQSAAPLKCGTWLVKNFRKIKNELKPATVQALLPYLVRPTHPESVFTRRLKERNAAISAKEVSVFAGPILPQEGDRPTEKLREPNWQGVESAKFPITVWTYLGRKAANAAITWIDDKNMWSEFEGLLGKTPPSDLDEKNDDGSPNNGIDGDLDIYLVPASPYLVDTSAQAREDIDGWCLSTREGKTSPSYILVDDSLTGDELCGTLAHELFHSFQAAIDQNERDWWVEGTAVWAEDLIHPSGNTEQDFVEDAFIYEDKLLDTLTSESGDHAYGIYIFPYYLSCKHGKELIGKMWKNCEDNDDLEAIDQALNGKFDEVFKKFALMNYDDSTHYLESYDEVLATFDQHFTYDIQLDSNDPPEPEVFDIPPLSAKYISVDNFGLCDPEKTPLVRFDLSALKANDKITVQAIIDPTASAKVEDWSDLDEKEFCLNLEEERFDQIILVIASSERNMPQPAPLLIDLERFGCGEGEAVATIDVHLTTVEDRDNTPKSGVEIDSQKSRGEARIRVRIELELEDEDYDEDTNEITESYLLKSWRITSSEVRRTSESHYYDEDQHGLKVENKRNSQGQGKAQKGNLPGGEGNMQIVFDGDTQKAKTVVFPFISVMITGETQWSKESTSRFGSPKKWHYNRTSDSGTSALTDMLPIWQTTLDMSGLKVTSGDGKRSFGGRGEHIEQDEHERKEYRSDWTVKRYKKKKKK